MAERSLRVILKAEVADYKRQMAEAAKATDKIPESAARAETALGRMVQSARYNRESWDAAGRVMLGFGAATIGGLALATKAAIDWESAWTGVLKTVDGTDSQLAALEDDLRQMARTLPATHQEIAAVAEAAGQLGIATPNVAAFTRTMIDLGETTNLSAQDAATGLARFANVMGTSQGDFDRLGSVIVGLGNNFATTEREILDMATRISSAGRVVGLAESDVLALATAMSSVGIEAEAGGSAISRVMIKVSSAVEAGGDDLEQFAQVAGMSSQAFAAKWREAPVDALLAVVGGLAEMTQTGEGTFGMLEELGFQDIRVTNAMLGLSNATELTSTAVALASDEWERNNALTIEAAKRYDTAASQLQVARNNINDAAISLGETFLPAVADAASGVADFAGWLARLPEPVQQAGGRLGAMAGVTALAAGGFLTLFPRVIDTVNAFKTLPPAVQGGLRGIGRIGGAAAAATVGFTVLTAGVEAYADANAKAVSSTEEATRALLDMEAAADLDDMFAGLGYGVDEVESLDGAIRRLVSPDTQDRMQDFGGNIRGIFGSGTTGRTRIEEQFAAIGEALASMVQSGNVDRAADKFDEIARAWRAQGGDLDDLRELMPAYTDSLAAIDNEADLATTSSTALADATQYVGQSTEEATAALDEWRQALADADTAFIDLSGAYQAVIDKNIEYAQSTADATESAEDSWETYYDGVTVSADDYIAQLQAQVDAQAAWEQNILDITARVKETMPADMQEAANAMIDELLALGPEGAAQVQLLHDMTDEQFAQVVTLWGQKGTDAVAEFTSQVESYRQPVIPLTADLSSAYAQIDAFRREAGRTIYVNAAGQDIGFSNGRGAQTGRAFGGPIPGPFVSPHADNVLIRATPGEYMHQVPAVNYWGRNFMDAVNRMDKAAVASQVQGLAYGGPVGTPVYVTGGASGSSYSGPLVGVMNLNEVTDTRGTSNAVARRLSMLGA